MSEFKLNNLRELSTDEQLALEGGAGTTACGACKCTCDCKEIASASHNRQAKEAVSEIKSNLN